jgi:peptidoglycan/LPS O-acetylase OafA/YrhL
MFGIWRTLLAIEVVLYHLAGVRIIGQYAVFAFFVLSGFLMTAIMQGSYGYSVAGFARYLQNRALRLYPSYWFALIVTVLLIAAFGAPPMRAFNSHMIMPATFAEWVQNLTIVFADWIPFDHAVRLVPPTWALTVEIFFYVAIGLGVSRTRRRTWVWVGVSLAYVVVAVAAHAVGRNGDDLYGAIAAGSLPFAMGAMTWHYRDEIHGLTRTLHLDKPIRAIALRWLSWAAFLTANQIIGRYWLVPLGNYVNIGLSMLIVCVLYHQRPGDKLRRIDKAVGDFSYPIYLLHWQGAAIASMLLFGVFVRGKTPEGLTVAGLGLVITILLGWICVRLIDPVVERRRTKIRGEAT